MLESKDRILGMLWGLHAGDSLGAPIEFLPPSKVWNAHTEMTGGGSFRWKVGEATDDTDLMLCVLRAIESPKKFSFDILKKEMLKWLDSKPPDIGTTTIRGLVNLKSGLPLRECGYVDNKFQGNGSLMRVAPLCLLEESVVGSYQGGLMLGLNDVIETQTKMTHGHHYCVESDKVLIAALKAIMRGGSKSSVFQAAQHEALKSSPYILERLLQIPVTPWENLKTSGFCVDTLCAALWAFLKIDNLEDALVAVVNRGDDSDSCGAVAGALCGAYYGPQAIPERWLSVLEFRDEIKQICLAGRF
ncbi:ADP-ribosylglycohydrolase family protein [Bdellovibrio reynosensis]|uniref:ADP-ribosylglycohydrolase family protein n=1 Tax=Bdellovibrio reynosensis TaxID=2835041 RepID=A0ABY4CD31_9BACT|nr:ADP-ribosylglycohydrolase family protein [Bdellovibrio reynosensis]UOF01576.1 ADP-ribosylglycohydrolase family protein [Bdellovibrio reynosensis]